MKSTVRALGLLPVSALALTASVAHADAVLTNGNDVFFGNSEDETVFALGGDDKIFMSEGQDVLWGDSYSPFPGDEDTIFFQAMDSVTVAMDPVGNGWGTATAGPGNSTAFTEFENMIGSYGDDTLIGSDGDNVIGGDDGRDDIYGEGGDDFLVGGASHDMLYDGPGEDLFVDRANDGNDEYYFSDDSDLDTLQIDFGDGTHKEQIYGFDVTQDRIDLTGSASFGDLNFKPWAGGTSVKVWAGTSGHYMIFYGVTAAEMNDSSLFI